MRRLTPAITSGITVAGLAAGAWALGGGVAAADPVPPGTYDGSTDVPGGELIWEGKTFGEGTVSNNFVFGFNGLPGTTTYEDGETIIDYTPSGLGFLQDRITEGPDGVYTGTVYVYDRQVAEFGLTPVETDPAETID